MITREPIYAALLGLLEAAADFAVVGRRLRHWSDVSPVEQPALFMAQKSELATIKTLGTPTAWTLRWTCMCTLIRATRTARRRRCSTRCSNAVEAALAPSAATGLQDLGLPATVQHAYISGKIETDEGVLGDQAVAIVPVEILCLA